jgi:prepilin-type N-terminal cleavage/methylation domain-containing protein
MKVVNKRRSGMNKGFTLLELLIVIIIVGVMATLGLTQYTTVVERSRGAEARQILGQLRSLCAALYLETNDVTPCSDATKLGLGDGTGGTIPSTTCAASHYFNYTATNTSNSTMQFVASRCTANGKVPQGIAGRTLTLTSDYSSGSTGWNSTYGY